MFSSAQALQGSGVVGSQRESAFTPRISSPVTVLSQEDQLMQSLSSIGSPRQHQAAMFSKRQEERNARSPSVDVDEDRYSFISDGEDPTLSYAIENDCEFFIQTM